MSEDLIDHYLPCTERLINLVNSDDELLLIQAVQCINESLQSCDVQFIYDHIIPAIVKCASLDSLHVAQYLLTCLPDFGENLFEYFQEVAEAILINQIMPVVHGIVLCRSPQLKEIISECWAALITILDPQDFLENEIPLLKKFSSSQKKEVKIVVLTVLSSLTDFFDPNIWYDSLYEMINQFTKDSASAVRSLVPPIIAQYSKKLTDPRQLAQLSGRFAILCRDSYTPVRKAAAESIVTLSESLDHASRLVTILPSVELLLQDPSELVRSIISMYLGPLISSIGPSVNSNLVHQFSMKLISKDITVAYPAAFSFPAVALTLGRERFDEIKSSFETASKSKEFRIRRTLSFGIHSFGHIIPPEDISSVVDRFLRDISSVSIGIVSNLNLIAQLIDNKKDLLFCLQEPLKKYTEWRMRLKVSEQLRYCSDMFESKELIDSAKDLLRDPVSVVRRDAVLSFVHLMDNNDMEFLIELAKSDKYADREIAAMIFEYADISKVKSVFDVLIWLTKDKVVNVRINAASAVGSIAASDENIKEFNQIINNLLQDTDADVKSAILYHLNS
ncbi:HEAT repeat family protein [Tritrichomonas foetus]|uniref:HEAT repeat family protein n=1 Tax=Tritrichomonas foetus TaxID=1144522 RepID=A0A1J4JB51_9EUKA|nr:HEAT repeat family protein [Tritrichomonas foetus]|eukprot:OHS95897.1 HEAT repeat family protein [Tritrichomonas foetus]